jgi:hypothetical protein
MVIFKHKEEAGKKVKNDTAFEACCDALRKVEIEFR